MSTIAIGFTPQSIADSGEARAPRLRITRRGRAVLTFLVAAPLVAATAGIVLNAGGATATLESTPTSFDYVTVESGQSLWQVAEQVAPASNPSDVVLEIVHLNQLDSSVVAAGQQVAVPVKYSR